MHSLTAFAALVSALFISMSAGAAQVTGARIVGDELIVNVRHGGGCGEHKYELVLGGCLESMPAQCRAELKHSTNDFCEAILSREAKFSLRELGLLDSYYASASLTIEGSGGSSTTVYLPAEASKRPAPRASENVVECVTHTGSLLTIDEVARSISLETTAGKKADFRIVGQNLKVLESMPPVYQETYQMDDGRSVVTMFRGEQRTGTGYFIRLGGETSPEFKSCRR